MLEQNTIILIVGLVLNLVITAVVGTRKLSLIELSLHKAIDVASKAADDRVDTETRNFGEVVAGLRQGLVLDMTAIRKEIAEEQKYVRDVFMRRESFYKVQETLQVDIRALGTELKSRLERMETKIDSKT